MNRLPVFWVPAPEEDDPDDYDRYVAIRLRDNWVAVDSDQLILPVTITERDGVDLDPEPGLLKQYGGEGLLNDMLLADQEVEAGSEWIVGHAEGRGRYIEAIPDDS